MPLKKPTAPHGLEIRTLSGLYEAARNVLHIMPIDTISTYTQMEARLKQVLKDKDLVMQLHYSLEELNRWSATLGNTTLVNPADHPLVTRKEYVPKKTVT